MAEKTNSMKNILLIVFCCLCTFVELSPVGAQAGNSSPPSAAIVADNTGELDVGYHFVIDSEGNPIYSQQLSWEGDPNALEYEVTVLDSVGAEIIKTRQEETVLLISLLPGEYTYNIVTINLLGQAETETGFIKLSILSAEIPEIDNVSPGFIFMDSLNPNVTIRGKKLLEGSRVLLSKKGSTKGQGIEGIEQSRVGDTELVVAFPESAYVPGLFDIAYVNPGGLLSKRPESLRILYQRPFDILVSVGYSPLKLIEDEWFIATWPEPMYWLGADSSLSLYFLKKAWGFLGLGVDLSIHRLQGGYEMALVTSEYVFSSMNLLYKFRINRFFSSLGTRRCRNRYKPSFL